MYQYSISIPSSEENEKCGPLVMYIHKNASKWLEPYVHTFDVHRVLIVAGYEYFPVEHICNIECSFSFAYTDPINNVHYIP